MEQTSFFRDIFNAALRDYQNQTGNSLIDHPFAKQLESCDSVDSVIAILQEQAHVFGEFRGDDGKLIKSMKYSVNILYTLSMSAQGIGLVRSNPFIDIPCF
jgi:fungal STAND N-terminal Goodbye domain